jgi:hypothetical protein
MRSRHEHVTQAQENEEFADLLIKTWGDKYANWAVVALFYAAAHYGRAFIIQRGAKTITNHPGFESYFHRFWKPPPELFSLYRRLKDESERARYDCAAYTVADFTKLKNERLIPFREAILKHLGR